jgi:biotin carboxyl carrier protein
MSGPELERIIGDVLVTLAPSGARVTQTSDRLLVRLDETTHSALAVRQGDKTWVSYRGHSFVVEKPKASRSDATGEKSGEVKSKMPGLVVDVLVSVGDRVGVGDRLMVLEAMKTHQPYLATIPGKIAMIVDLGSQVLEGQTLVQIDADS